MPNKWRIFFWSNWKNRCFYVAATCPHVRTNGKLILNIRRPRHGPTKMYILLKKFGQKWTIFGGQITIKANKMADTIHWGRLSKSGSGWRSLAATLNCNGCRPLRGFVGCVVASGRCWSWRRRSAAALSHCKLQYIFPLERSGGCVV